jgi:hypothetical protein
MSDPANIGDEAAPFENIRWSATRDSSEFFIDEDRLFGWFLLIVAVSAALFALMGAGLWRLQKTALEMPQVVGVAGGLVFRARAGELGVRDADLDRQFTDTVEILFGRTEKGLPPQVGEFCAPEVVSAAEAAYRAAAADYPAGYVQTLEIAQTKPVASRPGARRIYCRGTLASRSAAAAQVSPVYLDCTFVAGVSTPSNAAGWRLVRLEAIGPDEYFRDERDRAARSVLGLPPRP